MSELQSNDRKRKGRFLDPSESRKLSNEAFVKPEPPDDLWQQLDEAIDEITTPKRPEGSFTRVEFQKQRGGISEAKAARLLTILKKTGRIRQEGFGNNTYYVLVKS